MSNISKFRCLIIIVINSFLLISLTGCWSSHEAEENAVIDIMGIDINEKGEYEITASIVKTYQIFSLTSKNNSDGKGENSFIISTTGKSIVQAISSLARTIPKRLYFGHMNVLVLGNTFASKENLEQSLDYFKRENDFRPNLQLYVTKGKAKDIITTKPELKPTLGLEIRGMFATNRYATSSMVKDLSKFSEGLSSVSMEPYTGVLSNSIANDKLAQTGKVEPIGQESSKSLIPQESREASLSLNETAVFKNGKLVGYLNKEETNGLLWLKGDLVKDVIIAPCGDGSSEGNTSLTIRKVNTSISPEKNDSKIAFHVDIHADGEISEITCSTPSISSNYLANLNRQVEGIVRKEIDDLFRKIKYDWNTDIIGFGDQFKRKYPEDWRGMASSWKKDGFKDTDIDINIDFSITRFGLEKGTTSE
ncbi:Ger(x)C family spore germination protein [Bacillus sp. ISL-40]|uniref:Ger(x)C family spore germination protein n=1 Tax=unclassified Bacillus (in: firmicutes) TaxID=185979 RepID=UPI001BE8454E|nr:MULTISPECIES: Ger(x)C family spore germination protein [unclassified Bacillus (in: firmicutes)]MBT2696753.1 Ger(x)C family spore germination protein [Bacillus sp. ISL-40]MBT2721245.1 Ger(x)C family spore germination protein [Bacillus sp. ISL-46]MBT2740069.1 Ger(x)C family spore germination protein [Bacillus sp. ISL-77]